MILTPAERQRLIDQMAAAVEARIATKLTPTLEKFVQDIQEAQRELWWPQLHGAFTPPAEPQP